MSSHIEDPPDREPEIHLTWSLGRKLDAMRRALRDNQRDPEDGFRDGLDYVGPRGASLRDSSAFEFLIDSEPFTVGRPGHPSDRWCDRFTYKRRAG